MRTGPVPMAARPPQKASPTPGPRGGAAQTLLADAWGLVHQAHLQRTPLPVAPLQAAVEALGLLGDEGIAALCTLLQRTVHLGHGGGDVAEQFAGQVQLSAIEALAQAARARPAALNEAYAQQGDAEVQDSLCEAAAKLPVDHPAPLALMRGHLRQNPFVAALSLAQYGNAAALAPLQRCLDHQLNLANAALQRAPWSAATSSHALHVDGLVEAIATLGGALSAEAQARVTRLRQSSRCGLSPELLRPA